MNDSILIHIRTCVYAFLKFNKILKPCVLKKKRENFSESSSKTLLYFLNTIINILDLGFKFVPHLFDSELEFFNFLLLKIDCHTLELNKQLYFTKINHSLNQNRPPVNSNQRVNFEIEPSEIIKDEMDDYINIINSKSKRKNINLESTPLLKRPIFPL